MGDDHAGDRFTAKRSRHQLRPKHLAPVRRKPGVHDGPAIAIVQRVDIDVIELHWQGKANPQNPVSDLGCGALFGGVSQG